jgi:hypothetical protein
MDLDAGTAVPALDVRHQHRQEQRVHVVAGGNAEGGGGRLRLEATRVAEQHLGRAKNAGRGLDHSQPRVGGHHARARAHQQRVARQLAQALERRRHGRLVHAQADGGARDAAIGQHGVQNPYEMEVDLVEKRLVSHGCSHLFVIREQLYSAQL